MATHEEAANLVDHTGTARTEARVQPLNRRRALHVLGALAAAAAGTTALNAARPEAVNAATQSYTDTQSGPVLSATNQGTGAAVSGTNNVSSPINGSPGVVGESSSGIGVYGISLDDNYGGVYGQNNANGPGVFGTSSHGFGVQGQVSIGITAAGVAGDNSNDGAGVWGRNTSESIGSFIFPVRSGVVGTSGPGGYGVAGICKGSASSTGVYGTTDSGFGVLGGSDGGIGVRGGSGSGTGVQGLTTSSTNAGVEGDNSGSGPGVLGRSNGGVGVRGDSASSSNTSPGVYGVNTGGGPAIVGQATGSGFGFSAVSVSGTGCFGGASGAGTGVYAYSVGGPALVAFAAGGSNLAGYFSGPLYVTGALTVLGAKSAAVKAADGKLRRLYSLESPESWFEDFGKGELKGGAATVQLEPGFTGVVHGDDYRVFVTPQGDSNGLYVSSKTPSGFTVHEQQDGKSNVAFDYRVVAKRKDIVGARLEAVDGPPTLEVPTFPTLPATPPEPSPTAPRGHASDH